MWILTQAAALACGPDFPVSLLDDRAEALLELREGTFAWEAAHLAAPPAVPLPLGDDRGRSAHEAIGLTEPQQVSVAAMREAGHADRAYALGEGLPEDVRLYTAGAVAWHAGARDDARRWFEQVIALPADARARRGPWARYMLGRLGERAPEHFERLREEVAAGAADPEGLAVASLGEDARERWLAGDVSGAVADYTEQAAHGSWSGVASLLFVARDLVDHADPDALRARVADPLLRRLLVAYAWTRADELTARGGPVTAERLLAAIEAAGVQAEGADRLAAFAYDAGRYDLAGRAVAASPRTPLLSWVEAKLALRAGDLDGAARAYAEAAAAFPTGEVWSSAAGDGSPGRRVATERGLLALARGEYVAALRTLVAGIGPDEGWGAPEALGWRSGWQEAAYVAERVLTADELGGYLAEDGQLDPAVRAGLRRILARRLVRAGRAADAVPWFDDPEERRAAAAYADALARTARGDRFDRAGAWLDAAALARPALWLLGTEASPDWAMYAGAFDPTWGERAPVSLGPLAPEDEIRRVAASTPAPDRRFHYRAVAADHAEAAAALLPETSQAFAVSLCVAARAVRDWDEPRRQALYLRYLREGPLYDASGAFGATCPAPDLAGARSQARAARRAALRPLWVGLGIGGAGLALLFAAALAIRRRR